MIVSKRVLFLIVVMIVVVCCVGAASTALMYNVALNAVEEDLLDEVMGVAAGLDAIQTPGFASPDSAPVADGSSAFLQNTLGALMTRRHSTYYLARRDGEHIVYLDPQCSTPDCEPSSGPTGPPSEAMLRALDGQSGTMKMTGTSGRRVLAAYTSVSGTRWGLVTERELTELREPFVRATGVIALGSAVLLALGVLLLIEGSRPLLRDLEETQQRFRSLFDSMPLAYASHELIYNDDGRAVDFRVLDINPAFAEMTGIPYDEIVGQRATEMTPGLPPDAMDRYARILESGVPERWEQTARRSGKTYDMTGFRAGPARFVIVSTNVTERKRMSDELRQLNAELEDRVAARTTELSEANDALRTEIEERKRVEAQLLAAERLAALGALSGSIAHEIRNPLGTIDSSIYYLRHRLADVDEKVLSHLDRMAAAGRAALVVIESLLNLARADPPMRARLDLAHAASEVLASSRMPLGVRSHVDIEKGLMVQADASQFHMVLRNVIVNAVEAMNAGGDLRIAASSDGDDWAELTVSDSGPGIPPESLERVFDPLYTTKAKGIGFGLSIVRQVVERHGGTVVARSEPGQGATIVMRLPRYAPEPERREG